MSDEKKSKSDGAIRVHGIHLLTLGNGPTARIVVRVETDDGWRDAIVEGCHIVDAAVSHIVEPSGVLSSPRSAP